MSISPSHCVPNDAPFLPLTRCPTLRWLRTYYVCIPREGRRAQIAQKQRPRARYGRGRPSVLVRSHHRL